jgi:hypothetical protein
MEQQSEFLFADGPVPELHPPNHLAGFLTEVATIWSLPIGEPVQVFLSGHHFSELRGRLELARAPDLPLKAQAPLALRIGVIEFSNRQIVGWSLR